MKALSVNAEGVNVEKANSGEGVNNNIFIQDGQLLVKNFAINDDGIVNYFMKIPPKSIDNHFKSALKVGVEALKTVDTTEKIDYIEKAFAHLENKFDDALTKTTDNLTQSVDDVFGKRGILPKLMDENFGEKGAVSEIIETYFGENGKIIHDLFNPLKEGTPLHQLKTVILDEIDTVKNAVTAQETEERIKQKTTLKGLDFEDAFEMLLGNIVKLYKGDELERTSASIGTITNSRKGDFVIKVKGDPSRKIVIETKDKVNISLPEIHRELDEALKNREADYAIFVAKWVESLPNSVGCFNFYQENKAVCALGHQDREEMNTDMLEVAYCWTRTKLLVETIASEDVDYEKIESSLKKIKSKLKKFGNIKSQCTNIDNSSQAIRDLCDEIKKDINANLTEIYEQIG